MRTLGNDVQPGTRVNVVKDAGWNGPWPAEPTGVIDPDVEAPIRVIDLAAMPEVNVSDADRGPMREFMVRFDEPQRDGDGAGPYYAAAIWETYLRLVEQLPAQAIEYGNVVNDLPDRVVYYDPKNDVTVVVSKITGKIMSARRGAP